MKRLETLAATLACIILSLCSFAYALEPGAQAPTFSLPELRKQDGTAVNLADYQGKVVYVDFWASWCAPCVISTPLLNKLRHELVLAGEPFEVLAINVDKKPQEGINFLTEEPVEYITLSDPKGSSPAAYEVKGMPTAFLLDKTGKIRLIHQGFKASDIDKIKTEVLTLLKE